MLSNRELYGCRMSLITTKTKHLCPEIHAIAKMAKNRQKAGDSNWMSKVAPWRVAILAKMTNLDVENGEKSPEGWRFKLDGKSGPLKRGALPILAKMTNLAKNGKKSPGPLASGDFREIGDFGENGKILQKLQIWRKQRKIARGLAISRMWQIFKLEAKSGPFKFDN